MLMKMQVVLSKVKDQCRWCREPDE